MTSVPPGVDTPHWKGERYSAISLFKCKQAALAALATSRLMQLPTAIGRTSTSFFLSGLNLAPASATHSLPPSPTLSLSLM